MRKIGYIRVSSTSQNPSRQFQQLNEIGMDIIYEEKVSGATKDRELLLTLKKVQNLTGLPVLLLTDILSIGIYKKGKDAFPDVRH